MTDIFDEKNIKPMLFSEAREPFDSEEYIFELKLDGIRSLIYIDKTGITIRNKRNQQLNSTYPELAGIYRQVGKRCILDGEIFVMNNGKPDFSEMQRRSLMTNAMKIQIALNKLPVSFSAYDILYVDNTQITGKPLLERKSILQDIVKEGERLSVSRFIPDNGTALYSLTVEKELEGVVAKKKDSKYLIGKTTREWAKIKNLKDEDFVICGYTEKDNGARSLILGAYEDGRLIYQSHVSLGVSNIALDKIFSIKKLSSPLFDMGGEYAVWIEPVLVCTVKYMMRTKGGSLRQPVFKGLRDDKEPEECIVNHSDIQ